MKRIWIFGILVCSVLLLAGCSQEPETEESEYIVFHDRMTSPGDTFVLNNSKSCMGSVRMKLLSINDSHIKLQRIGDEKLDGKIHAEREKDNITLHSSQCISAPVLCLDVSYRYCLTLKRKRLFFNTTGSG